MVRSHAGRLLTTRHTGCDYVGNACRQRVFLIMFLVSTLAFYQPVIEVSVTM